MILLSETSQTMQKIRPTVVALAQTKRLTSNLFKCFHEDHMKANAKPKQMPPVSYH